jgi:hypothetical protein
MDQNRLDILRKVENSELTLVEASKLLDDLEQNKVESDNKIDLLSQHDATFDERIPIPEKEKPAWSFIFWVIPVLLGALLTIFASTWLYENYIASGLGFKFWLTWIPLLIGVFLIYFGWLLQRARWIHLNIKQPKGESPQRIFFAFPLPFQFIGFILRIFKGKIPSKVSNLDIEDLMVTIDQHIKKDEPLSVHVDDEDGTQVDIYIG